MIFQQSSEKRLNQHKNGSADTNTAFPASCYVQKDFNFTAGTKCVFIVKQFISMNIYLRKDAGS